MKKLLITIWEKFWVFMWGFFDDLYKFTGLRWQVPIEYFFPHFCQWMFEQMMGSKGTRIDGKHLDIAIANTTDEDELKGLQKEKNRRIILGKE